MDYQAYQALHRDRRQEIWRQLKTSDGWQVLCELLLKQASAKLPDVMNQDSKEAFYAQSLKTQAILELIQKPDELINDIERGRKQS